MARRSLKPQLNQIRTWVREGRTDAWIAHQLDVSVSDIRSFKREHELAPSDGDGDAGGGGAAEETDLRAEDDALVAAALEAEEEDREDEEPEAAEESEESEDSEDEPDEKPRRRRRGRRGGRRRTGRRRELEGTFDHGEEGYGLWLDPAVADDPVYAEHWAGHRQVTVVVEAERIVITRSDDDSSDEEGEGED